MWLRNLCVFLGTNDFGLTAAGLDDALAGALCPSCGEQTVSVGGFVPPIKGEHAMVHAVDGLAIGVYQEISRVLPGPVVSEEVAERVEALEAKENRKVSRREKADIREQAHFELLPRAFTRSKRTTFVVDLRASRIWVDAGSENTAETVVAALREALGSLPVTRPEPRIGVATELSRWITETAALPNGFECGDRCVLESSDEDKASLRITSMDLAQDEIRAHLAAGMQATKLNVAVDDAIEFDVDENLDLKRVRALDLIQDDLDSLDADDAVAELTARIALQGEALRGVLDRLYTHFGVAGESKTEAA
ncbi:recombination-associated protein RdgC [Salinisphaera sp. Q1T1-3]|uniref:recombination-associated protein RdgC n=1 Tax=Salinisphaera sp. Q1T1-3 TaxID=2321229 RepID=UPI000E767833|nr:recombination-associated protein RdgC [Salinisphaera sp. Q1T1-3]RJS91038.1 recombination-associated protein RdgC [Salinisphaera sp. Q1T1-3]